jgi:hypothetical protein
MAREITLNKKHLKYAGLLIGCNGERDRAVQR